MIIFTKIFSLSKKMRTHNFPQPLSRCYWIFLFAFSSGQQHVFPINDSHIPPSTPLWLSRFIPAQTEKVAGKRRQWLERHILVCNWKQLWHQDGGGVWKKVLSSVVEWRGPCTPTIHRVSWGHYFASSKHVPCTCIHFKRHEKHYSFDLEFLSRLSLVYSSD